MHSTVRAKKVEKEKEVVNVRWESAEAIRAMGLTTGMRKVASHFDLNSVIWFDVILPYLIIS